MNKLIADMTMSLDGFIADENDGVTDDSPTTFHTAPAAVTI
jgi:hypothetical protein